MASTLIKQLTQQLVATCKDTTLAEQEAWWLLEAVTNKRKHEILSLETITLTLQEQNLLASFIKQRIHEHKPLQYILGSMPFCGLTIHIRPPILIPRPETEEWVTWLIEQLSRAQLTTFTALDLCSGSGCIGLALAKNFPHATIVGVDLNPQAIELANENKKLNNVTNISFIQSDMFNNLPRGFSCNLITSNPPYLSLEEYHHLDTNVRTWEDRNALIGGDDGMLFYRHILHQAKKILNPLTQSQLPNCFLEIGPVQETHLEQLLEKYHVTTYTIHKDMSGKQRWVSLKINV